MIEEIAVVEKITGDRMDLRISKPEQCDACAIRESCYGRGNVISVPRQAGIREHDTVVLSIRNASILGLSALIYGVPLLGLLVGMIVGYYGLFAGLADTAKTLASAGVGVGLLGACGFVVRLIGRRISAAIEYRTQRLGEETERTGAESIRSNEPDSVQAGQDRY